jgi:hypothetical protein
MGSHKATTFPPSLRTGKNRNHYRRPSPLNGPNTPGKLIRPVVLTIGPMRADRKRIHLIQFQSRLAHGESAYMVCWSSPSGDRVLSVEVFDGRNGKIQAQDRFDAIVCRTLGTPVPARIVADEEAAYAKSRVRHYGKRKVLRVRNGKTVRIR